ncbi:MAG TPA: hypothetical protein P5077_12135 [bacterium]|nr:hypothetical protein [bacterium]
MYRTLLLTSWTLLMFAACDNAVSRHLAPDRDTTTVLPDGTIPVNDEVSIDDHLLSPDEEADDIGAVDLDGEDQTDALIRDDIGLDDLLIDDDPLIPDLDIDLGDCPELTAGWNTDFIVTGEWSKDLSRSFIISLPDGIGQRRDWPVVFNWHGVGVSADFFLPMLDGWQNNDTMPFILITPEDTGLPMATIPPQGVDWDNLVLDDGSIEAELFDRIVECLDRQFGVDHARIHLTGFSAGSITCDTLGVLRGERVASIFTYSGAYFSNPANLADLGAGAANFIHWPTLETSHKFVQVLVHGAGDPGCSTRDCGDPNGNCCDIWSTIGLSVNFEHMAENDAPYLSGLGHDVILCDHGQGHLMGGVTQPSLIRFFHDHPLGTTISPYRDGLIGEFYQFCALVPAQ